MVPIALAPHTRGCGGHGRQNQRVPNTEAKAEPGERVCRPHHLGSLTNGLPRRQQYKLSPRSHPGQLSLGLFDEGRGAHFTCLLECVKSSWVDIITAANQRLFNSQLHQLPDVRTSL